jgi:hypothetical protein
MSGWVFCEDKQLKTDDARRCRRSKRQMHCISQAAYSPSHLTAAASICWRQTIKPLIHASMRSSYRRLFYRGAFQPLNIEHLTDVRMGADQYTLIQILLWSLEDVVQLAGSSA